MRCGLRRLLILAGGVAVAVPLAAAVLYLFLSRTNAEVLSSGASRKYLLHVPDSHDPAQRAPLVISLHGAWLYPGMQQRLTRWNALADRHGFIVAYPRAAGFPRSWRLEPGPGLDRELRFFEDLIDELIARYNVDPSRIFVSGYSNGAAMTFMLSCRLGERIAAFGMVATAIVPWEWCAAGHPVPMVAFHGTADPYTPYQGGQNFLTTEPLPSVEDWFSRWGKRNRCRGDVLITRPVAGVSLHEHQDCAGAAAARLYTLSGAGHIWPGGRKLPEFGTGPYSGAIDATGEMWAFFVQHPLREGAQSR
jgi:polyhydroxybutyrate depolymerase